MSIKRQATTELNHNNWDQEDPEEEQDMGMFKTASKDVLEKRVIRTAKRRSQLSTGEPEAKKSVFSGFGGFNKTQPSSFDFLAKLTNGNKKTDTQVTSSLFSSKPLSSSTNSAGIFGVPTSTPTKPNFGIPTTQQQSPDGSQAKTSPFQSAFTSTKADSTVGDSPFKIQPVSSSADTNRTDTTNVSSPPQVSSSLFVVSSTTTNVNNKSLFSSTNSTPFKTQPILSTGKPPQTSFGVAPKSDTSVPAAKAEESANEKKMTYYSKLKGLNESVSDWIKKHVEQTPLCILSPIFKDYEKYLKEIQEEYHGPDKDESNKKTTETSSIEPKAIQESTQVTPKSTLFATNNGGSSLFNTSPSLKTSVFTSPNKDSTSETKTPFSFGINNTISTSSTTTTSTSSGFSFGTSATSPINANATGFSFGANTTTSTTNANSSASFSFATNTTTSPSGGTPFSFGMGKPFSFNSNINTNTNPEQKTEEKEEDEEPPKVEFTPVVEENSVYDKRCKIFVKKDGNFVDKGIGTLYVKKVEETGKHQLLVRANTNLGNVLLNFILASAIPTQRMGKNNVMLVCIPTPESKPPPTPILIRVRTAEEADDLLETLNKYKS